MITFIPKPIPIIQGQTSTQTAYCLAQPLAQARRARSGEPPSPKRGLERASRNQRGISLRRDPSCLGEMFARSKIERVAWATFRANGFGRVPVHLA